MTALRVWDGITDPFVGFIIDKTDGKFGKNRPFIVIGQIIMIVGTGLIFLVCPTLPEVARLPFYIICYMFYIIGYTCQCVVTKSAQTCLTNDPEQRPIFSVFDTIYNMAVFGVMPIYITSVMVPKHNIYDAAGNIIKDAFDTPTFHAELWGMCVALSIVFAILAMIGLWRKDNKEFYGTGKPQLLKLTDYVEVVKKNRAIQMLCVAACSDKLTMTMQRNAVIMTMLFGIIIGNYDTYSAFNGITSIFGIIVPMMLILVVARKMGQKQALLVGTYGGIIGAISLFLLLWLGDPTLVSFTSINFYTIAFVGLYIIMQGFGSLSSSIVIPMTADCADYEVYRSGKYVPGLMGTLFSFIDKVTSSLATTFIALMLAMIGFAETQPVPSTPYSDGIFWVTMICLIGAPLIGWILNLIAMKYYPLNKEMMASIQEEIARIKAEYQNAE